MGLLGVFFLGGIVGFVLPLTASFLHWPRYGQWSALRRRNDDRRG